MKLVNGQRKRGKDPLPLLDRILPYIEKLPFSGCWIWMRACDKLGYGIIHTGSRYEGNDRSAYTHKVLYEIMRGPVPDGLNLDHKCRVHSCVNPDHLEPVTQQLNVLRGVSLPAQRARQTHCKKGHELGAVKTYPSGRHRQCVECARQSALIRGRRQRGWTEEQLALPAGTIVGKVGRPKAILK